MNTTRLLIQFLLFSFLAFNIAFILSLITTEQAPKILATMVVKNMILIYITVFFLSVFTLALVMIF